MDRAILDEARHNAAFVCKKAKVLGGQVEAGVFTRGG